MLFLLSRLRLYRISIHAPREGGDFCFALVIRLIKDFNPRPPRGGRPSRTRHAAHDNKFQSTPPARGATVFYGRSAYQSRYFNPRPPRGGRLGHEPHGVGLTHHFNPRPPRGGRPRYIVLKEDVLRISIHAPREGGDLYIVGASDFCCFNFNPRPPRGGRQQRCTVLSVNL